MRFPRCAACQKSPGKLCPGHGGALSNLQSAEQAEGSKP